MITLAKRFDQWLQSHLPLLFALLLLLILRIPNFFEPYWYGDEGIYLTVGQAIRDGEKLYVEIVDHKTPLIYYFASVPNQLSFRVLNLLWMVIATSAFYGLAKKIIDEQWGVSLATFLFVILTSVPWFEGNIPNGELFAMGFILLGGWILSQTGFFDFFLEQKKSLQKNAEYLKLFGAGFLFGLAILTKVPAVLDVGAFILLVWFVLTNRLRWKSWWQVAKKTSLRLMWLLLGLIVPILISILYFQMIGSGPDYLQFGLLYNFKYTNSWGLPFESLLLKSLFTLPAKFLLTSLVVVVVTIFQEQLKPAFQFALSWLALALFAALLSNRPYPHYFQQILPPLALLIGLVAIKLKTLKRAWLEIILALTLISTAAGALLALGFKPYPTVSYYQRFYQLITKHITPSQYRHSFNHLMTDNYQAAEIIKQAGVDEIFIWGTNPMLYALSETQPTGRFTVSFHIKDLGVYAETMAAVRQKEPLFIVVMDNEHEALPGLEEFLEESYVINANFDHFEIWKRFE